MKSLRAQIHAMRRRWPSFEMAHALEPAAVIWFGTLLAIERPFRVSIHYGLPYGDGDLPLFRIMPVVRVLNPRLRLNSCALDEAPLPHVYFEEYDLENSPLCLFDPAKKEWDHSKLIADTTVPWTIDWLTCYEAWDATGRWHGGGRHADMGKLSNG